MATPEEKETKAIRRWYVTVSVYAVLFLLIVCFSNYSEVSGVLTGLLSDMKAILIGVVGAVILNPFQVFLEGRCFRRVQNPRVRRFFGILGTIIFTLLVAFLLVYMVLPQFMDSLVQLVQNYQSYLSGFAGWLNECIAGLNEKLNTNIGSIPEDTLINALEGLFETDGEQNLLQWLMTKLPGIGSQAFSTAKTLLDWIFGCLLCFLILARKEVVLSWFRMLFSHILPERVYDVSRHVVQVVQYCFSGFIQGKILDSAIIGVLTYFLVLMFDIPYPILMATFVGITNIIPFIGPIIGAIPTSFIILLAEPEKVIPFLIIVLCIQQLDGNVIGPAILGNNTGVSALCVLISITIVGNMWGLVGMLLGVPIFATILTLLEEVIEKKLHEKGRSMDLADYYPHGFRVGVKENEGSPFMESLLNHALRMEYRSRREPDFVPTERQQLRLKLYRIFLKLGAIQKPGARKKVLFVCAEREKEAEKKL